MNDKTNDQILRESLNKIIANTAKLQDGLKWYEIAFIGLITAIIVLASVAFTKLFL